MTSLQSTNELTNFRFDTREKRRNPSLASDYTHEISLSGRETTHPFAMAILSSRRFLSH
jgi:hypothetical protein